MGWTGPLFMRITAKDPTDDALVELIDPDDVENLVMSTVIPGGFDTLSFEIPATDAVYFQWKTERFMYRLLLEESGTRTIWEGRLERIRIIRPGIIRLVFRGYWRNFRDSVFANDATPYSKDYNTTADLIVGDMLANGFHADTIQISTSILNLTDPGPTIDQTYPDEWSLWQALTDASRGVLSFPDSSDRRVDLAVWEDQEVYLTPRNPTVVDWRAYLRRENGAGIRSFPLEVDLGNVANAIRVLYSSGTQTGTETDADSISDFIRIEHMVDDIGTSVQATAEERRGEFLASHKDLQQQISGIQVDRVLDANLIDLPLWRVRAGDVIEVPDWLTRTSELGSLALDAERRFFIEATSYNHQTGVLTITPDRDPLTLADILGSNRIRGVVR